MSTSLSIAAGTAQRRDRNLMAYVRDAWREWHRPLMICAALMTGLVLICAVGLLVDDRTLLNESVWVKPMKFGFAFAAYTGALAWLLTKLRKGRRLGWWVGTMFAVAAVLEVGAITIQAARGTFSHFNGNLTDSVTQAILPILTFGVGIILIAQLIIATVVLIQRTGGPAVNATIRYGLVLATYGMLVPVYWMVTEIHPRTVTDANGTSVQMYQGHGIGDPDGNGMPITNWSVTGGDFRVPHFFALHGIHVLLLIVAVLAVLAARRAWMSEEAIRARLVRTAALGYCGLVAIVTWQAGRGQSLIHPDRATLIAVAVLALVTSVATARVIVKAKRAAAVPAEAENAVN